MHTIVNNNGVIVSNNQIQYYVVPDERLESAQNLSNLIHSRNHFFSRIFKTLDDQEFVSDALYVYIKSNVSPQLAKLISQLDQSGSDYLKLTPELKPTALRYSSSVHSSEPKFLEIGSGKVFIKRFSETEFANFVSNALAQYKQKQQNSGAISYVDFLAKANENFHNAFVSAREKLETIKIGTYSGYLRDESYFKSAQDAFQKYDFEKVEQEYRLAKAVARIPRRPPR